MPSTQIGICNRALSRIKAERLVALDGRSQAAVELAALWPEARDAVLRDHPWNFARKRLALALLTDEYEGWDYAYSYPSDCIRALWLYNSNASDTYGTLSFSNTQAWNYVENVKFEIALAQNGTSRVLLSDEADAILLYTARVETPALFDAMFADALAWRLAAELALSLRGDVQVQQAMAQQYMLVLSQAQRENANEGYKHPNEASNFLAARN